MSFSHLCIEYNSVNRIWNDVSTSNLAHSWSTWVGWTCWSTGTSSSGRSASSPACRRKDKDPQQHQICMQVHTLALRGSSDITGEGSSDPMALTCLAMLNKGNHGLGVSRDWCHAYCILHKAWFPPYLADNENPHPDLCVYVLRECADNMLMHTLTSWWWHSCSNEQNIAESDGISTALRGIKDLSCPCWSRFATAPFALIAKCAGSHELIVWPSPTLRLAILDAGPSHILKMMWAITRIIFIITEYIAN